MFLDRPTGVVSSKCDVPSHHIVFDMFAEAIHECHLVFEFDHGNFKTFKPTKH
jgi:hypothetical protein